MNTRVAAFAVLVLMLYTGRAQAYAYRDCGDDPIRWDDDSALRVWRDMCSMPDGSAPAQIADQALREAMRYTSIVPRETTGLGTSCSVEYINGESEIGVVDPGELDGALGMTVNIVWCGFLSDENIDETDVLIASNADFGAFDLRGLPGSPGLARVVTMHEFGHALGLEHTSNLFSVMKSGSLATGTRTPELLPDDVAGLRFLTHDHREHLQYSKVVGSLQYPQNGRLQVDAPMTTVTCPGTTVRQRFSVGNTSASARPVPVTLAFTLVEVNRYTRHPVGEWVSDIGGGTLPSYDLAVDVPSNTPPGLYQVELRAYKEGDLGFTVNLPTRVNVEDCRNPDLPIVTSEVMHEGRPTFSHVPVRTPNALEVFFRDRRSRLSRMYEGREWNNAGVFRDLLDGVSAVALPNGTTQVFTTLGLNISTFTSGSSFTSERTELHRPGPGQTNLALQFTATSNNDGQPELWAIDGFGRLSRVDRFALTEGWGAGRDLWGSLGPVTDGTVAMRLLALGRDGDGRVMSAAVGHDGHIWITQHTSATSTELFGMRRFGVGESVPIKGPGGYVAQIVAGHTSNRSGRRFSMFVVLADGQVYQSTYTACRSLACYVGPRPPTVVSPWTRVWFPAPIVSLTVANNAEDGVGNGRMELIGATRDLRLYNVWQTDIRSHTAWASEAEVSQSGYRGKGISDLRSVESEDGHIHVFGTGPDNTLRTNFQTPDSWTHWWY